MTDSDVALFPVIEAGFSARLTAVELPGRAEEWRRFGVGLALSRGLAEAQGATLRAEPRPRGARFVLGFAPAGVPRVEVA